MALVIDGKLKTDVGAQQYGSDIKQVIKDSPQPEEMENDIRH